VVGQLPPPWGRRVIGCQSVSLGLGDLQGGKVPAEANRMSNLKFGLAMAVFFFGRSVLGEQSSAGIDEVGTAK
jgi:hypothetical protein